MKKTGANKRHIMGRYAIITGTSLVVAALIIYQLFSIAVINGSEWKKAAARELSKTSIAKPLRGSILSDKGNILACTVNTFHIKLDMQSSDWSNSKKIGIKSKTIDSLADSLDRYYPLAAGLEKLQADEREKKSWRTKLRNELAKDVSDRNASIYVKKCASEEDYQRILSFPGIRNFYKPNGKLRGSKHPIGTERAVERVYPYGDMAKFSIGRVSEMRMPQPDKKDTLDEIHGYSGLEKDFDKLLYGVPGKKQRMSGAGGTKDVVVKKPQHGYNVYSTINIDMQDMLDEELRSVCVEANAIWATAIIMETSTGAIKALSNIELLDDNTYGEARNRAGLRFEPGSVIKPISLMVAFEDGLVKSVNDAVDCSPFQGTVDNHAPAVKNMKQVIGMSSNTGIARVLFRGYKDHPENYHDRLEKIGFFESFHSGLGTEHTPYFPRLTATDRNGSPVTMTARHLSLARQTYGYNSEIPPIYTLAYYNAIANGGMLVYPHLISKIEDEDGRDSVLQVKTLRVCSKETADKVAECLRYTVTGNGSDHTTAMALKDDRVALAGKTGTAYPVFDKKIDGRTGYDLSRRRYAFAGFFPYESPKYSMMVLILAPAGTSAARTSGKVMLNIALRLYSRGLLDNTSSYTDMNSSSTPVFTALPGFDASYICNMLGISSYKRFGTAAPAAGGQMPDLHGYDPETAIATLERMGVNARILGVGHVATQDIPPGTQLTPGKTVYLTLKI